MALITLLMFILCVLTFFKLWYDNYYNLTFNFPKSSAPKKFKSCDVVIKFQAALNRFCWGKQFVFLLLLCVAMPNLSIPETKFHHRMWYLHHTSMQQWFSSCVDTGKVVDWFLHKGIKRSYPRLRLPRIMYVFDNIKIVTMSQIRIPKGQ